MRSSTAPPRKYPVCSTCGSIAVLADAFAEWDHERQDWTLRSAFQESFCEECGAATSLEWVEGDPPAAK